MAFQELTFASDTRGTAETLNALRDNDAVQVRAAAVWALAPNDTGSEGVHVQKGTAHIATSDTGPGFVKSRVTDTLYAETVVTWETGTGKTFSVAGAAIPHITGTRAIWHPKSTGYWHNKTDSNYERYGCGRIGSNIYTMRVGLSGADGDKGQLMEMNRATGSETIVWEGGGTASDLTGDFLQGVRDFAIVTEGSTDYAYITDSWYAPESSGNRIFKVSIDGGTLETTYAYAGGIVDITGQDFNTVSGITFDETNSNFWTSGVDNDLASGTRAVNLVKHSSTLTNPSIYNIDDTGAGWDGILALEWFSGWEGFSDGCLAALVYSYPEDGNIQDGPTIAAYEVLLIDHTDDPVTAASVKGTFGLPSFVKQARGLGRQTDTVVWWLAKEGTDDFWIVQCDQDRENAAAACGLTATAGVDHSSAGHFYQGSVSGSVAGSLTVAARALPGTSALPGPHRVPKGEIVEWSVIKQGTLTTVV